MEPKQKSKALQNIDVALTFGFGVAGTCVIAPVSIPLAAGMIVLTFICAAITSNKK